MAPDNLEAKVRFLEQHPDVGMVHSSAQAIDAQGKPGI